MAIISQDVAVIIYTYVNVSKIFFLINEYKLTQETKVQSQNHTKDSKNGTWCHVA